MKRLNGTNSWNSAAARRLLKIARSDNVDHAVVKIASELLEDIPSPPTDLDLLMARLNVERVATDDGMLVPGELRMENGKLWIAVSPELPTGRRRFTIAHELGHAFFESTGPRPPRTGKELEWICDKLAAEFLMPRSAFLDYAGKSPDITCLLHISKTFLTSRAAVFRRAAELCGKKAFEYQDPYFNWSFGLNPATKSSLRLLLNQSRSEPAGNEQITLPDGHYFTKWNMEWKIMEDPSRTIYLMTPV